MHQSFEIVLQPPRVDHSKIWSLHQKGLSQSAIAKELACSKWTIARALELKNDLKTKN